MSLLNFRGVSLAWYEGIPMKIPKFGESLCLKIDSSDTGPEWSEFYRGFSRLTFVKARLDMPISQRKLDSFSA